MNTANKQLIFGSRFIKPKETHVFNFAENVVGGITPGRRSSIQKKFDGNEDALGFIGQAGGDLLLVADSHFGSLAADLAVTHFEEQLPAEDWWADPVRHLFAAHLNLDRLIESEKRKSGAHLGCSTTFISVAVRDSRAYLCATGDSSCYLLRQGALTLLNEHHEGLFLGELAPRVGRLLRLLEGTEMITPPLPDALVEALYLLSTLHQRVREERADHAYMAPVIADLEERLAFPLVMTGEDLLEPWHPLHVAIGKYLPVWGSVSLAPGDLLFLASDGVEEDVSGCTLDDITAIVSDAASPLSSRAQALLNRCLGKSGGRDNLSFLIARY